jgi:hypothetical protein
MKNKFVYILFDCSNSVSSWFYFVHKLAHIGLNKYMNLGIPIGI